MQAQALREFQTLALCYRMPSVRTVDDIRRENLGTLVRDAGGVTALATIVGVDTAQMSQWLNGSKESSTGRRRGMRADSCRKVEAKAGKPPGWLDTDHSGRSTLGEPQAAYQVATAKARGRVKAAASLSLQLALAFDELPETFADGGTKRQFLNYLLGLIQERPHRTQPAAAQGDSPRKAPGRHPKTPRGKDHAH